MLALGTAPALAAENTTTRTAADAATKSVRHVRHHAHQTSTSRSEKPAAKSSAKSTDRPTDKPTEQRKADAADRAGNARDDAALPATVANAQAQMNEANAGAPANSAGSGDVQNPSAPGAATAQGAASAVSPGTDANTPVATSDQLNDVDRAAAPEKPTGKILRPVPQSPHLANATAEDTWSQTSLVGKVFIVLGGCLTLASAARMFIA